MSDKFIKGLWQDARPTKQPNGTYFFGKNGIQYYNTNSIKNEPGFNIDPVVVPGIPIGVIETDGNPVIFSVLGNVSHIGYYNKVENAYESIKTDEAFPITDKLNFSVNNPITGEYYRDDNGDINIHFTDKVTKPKALNCDDPGSVNSATDMLMFLQAELPVMEVNVEAGGSLAKGAYFVFMKYLRLDGSSTGYILSSDTKFVSSSDSGTTSDKALAITLSSLDITFDQVQIAVISRINGVYTAVELEPVDTSTGIVTIIHSGENRTKNITMEEVLIPYPVYTRIGAMGQLNGALYIADLEIEPEIDLQPYVNMIKLRVKSELIDATPPPDEHISGNTRSLMHQEVYAVYVRLRRKGTGRYTKAFVIPGNEPLSSDLLDAAGVHEIELDASVYQTQDTIRNVDFSQKTTDTGIWVNQNEEYPNADSFNSSTLGGPDLRGTNVRHHRMPSIAWCKENLYQGEPEYGRSKLDVLSLQVTNFNLPADIQDQFDGYELLIAKRNVSNSTVIGQSLLMVSAQSISNAVGNVDLGFTSTGGNWHSLAYNNSLGPANPVKLVLTGRDVATGSSNNPNAGGRASIRFRLHSFDMLFNKPSVSPAYIAPQLKMRVNNLPPYYPTGGYIEAGEGLGVDDIAPGYPIIAIIDYTKGIVPTVPTSTQRVRAVENTRYLPNNALTGRWDNRDLESAYVGNLKWIGDNNQDADNDLPLTVSTSYPRLDEDQANHERIQWEETYLVNLMDLKEDVYLSFLSQTLIPSGKLLLFGTAPESVYVGDTFINDYSFHTYGLLNADNITNEDNEDPTKYNGYKIVRRFVTEAVSNINLRQEIEGNIYSQWWPKTSLAATPGVNDTSPYIWQMVRSIDPNQFGYSRDFNSLNELTSIGIFNPSAEYLYKFPFRVHRGLDWRTFLPLDYKDVTNIFGSIQRILGKDDQLLIHFENALLGTQDKAKLESDVLSITLGSGDIFQFAPQEVLSARLGYAGTQHNLAAIDTPVGYVFIDGKAGNIFIFKKGLRLINNGLNQLFQRYLKELTENNPFLGNGITIGFDREYKRILVTVKNKQLVADIESFVPGYVPTTDFISGLTQNESIVLREGKFVKFVGEYDPEGFVCDQCAEPTADPVETSVDEDSPAGFVITRISGDVLEPETPENQYNTFQIISGNTGNVFGINSFGDLYVLTPSELDFETTEEYELVVRLTTNCGKYVDIDVTVSVVDVNEPPEVYSDEISILEILDLNTEVYEVSATDPEGTSLTYTLNTSGVPFTLNSSTGILKLTGTLNKDITPFYLLSITVTDADMLSTTITLRINIDDTVPFFTGYNGTCIDGDLVFASVAVRANAYDGPILTIVDNDGSSAYMGMPIPTIPDEVDSESCSDTEDQFIALNNSAGGTIDAVETSTGSIFFILSSGAFPLLASESASGIGVTSNPVRVYVTLVAPATISLQKNGVDMETKEIAASGFTTFDAVHYTTSDTMTIIMTDSI